VRALLSEIAAIYTAMTHAPSTMIYEPSETGAAYVAAAFSPDGKIQARRSFDTREAAEAFLQAFMQEKAGEYGLVNRRNAAESSGDLRDRRAGVIRSARNETKRRRLGIHGRQSQW
jgi:hypothetical protein